MLPLLGQFHAQETDHGQNGDHERGIEKMHSEEPSEESPCVTPGMMSLGPQSWLPGAFSISRFPDLESGQMQAWVA